MYIYIYVISGSLSTEHCASSGCVRRNGLHIWRVAANTFNKQSRRADKGGSASLGVGRGGNSSPPEKPTMLRNISQVLIPC